MKRPARAGMRWTPHDLHVLRHHWHDVTLETLARRLQRSAGGVHHMASREGLPLGVPQGMVSVARCAVLMGYAWKTMLRILERARVRICRVQSCSVYRMRMRGRRAAWKLCVSFDEARDAVEARLALETLARAAARLRVDHVTLSIAYDRAYGHTPDRTAIRMAPAAWDALRESAAFAQARDVRRARQRSAYAARMNARMAA